MIFETADILISAHSHVHDIEGESVWQQAFELITEPAHAITEVFYSLLFDALLIPITILIYKKIREPKLRQEIHNEIDKEHGIDHLECTDKDVAEPFLSNDSETLANDVSEIFPSLDGSSPKRWKF